MGESPHCKSLQRISTSQARSSCLGFSIAAGEICSSILVVASCFGVAFCLLTACFTFTSCDEPSVHSNYLRASSRSLATQSLASQNSSSCDKACCAAAFPCASSSDPAGDWINDIPLTVQILLIIILILSSAMFAGLTLGLMSLDKTGLEIVMSGDDVRNAEAARKIYPVRKNGNLLLCTLLLGNVAINALLSILLADKTGGLIGFFASTFLILVFGEIVPQAVCTRYPLTIGSATVPIVRVIIVLFYPITFPLSFILNKALGREVATTYNQSEMLKLLQIHVQEDVLDKETAGAMTGALKYKNTPVKQVMTPLEHTFMINVDEKLSFETIAIIFKTGYSRIPVYEISKNNVIGLLFVKDLIFVDPEDETPIRSFIQIFGRAVHVVWPDECLGSVLRELKQGRSHMAIVRDVNSTDDSQDPYYEIKGIITLEDIIEEIIGDEIVDETDAFVDGLHLVRVNRGETFDWGRLRLLDSKIVDEMLSYDEVRAVTAHLRTNHSHTVALLTDHQLHRLVEETNVETLSAAIQEIGQEVPADLLYERGAPTDVCTLILAGKVAVLAGAEKFRSDVSAWSVLGGNCLTDSLYKPDFTAFVSGGPCRCLRFTRTRFAMAVDASALERHSSSFGGSTVNNHLDSGRSLATRGRALSETEEDAVVRHVAKCRRIKLMEAIQSAGLTNSNASSAAPDIEFSNATGNNPNTTLVEALNELKSSTSVGVGLSTDDNRTNSMDQDGSE